MQIKRDDKTSDTTVKLTIQADQSLLDEVRQQVLRQLGSTVKVQGFRPGKAPLNLVEKQLDQSQFQTEFLEQAVNRLYVEAIQQEKLRPVAPPEVSITKFVPFTTLEITTETEVVGDIKLPDYKLFKLAKPTIKVTEKDVDAVIDDLKKRAADKQDVQRASKAADELLIDFKGVDAKTKDPISGADGDNYPLQLGSDTFIPGFEAELIGLKAGAEKEFTLTFPKDYGVAALQNRKVSFSVKVHTVQELVLPKLDDAFAATIGPFKSLAELRADIKKQVKTDREQQADRDYENDLLQKLAEKTTVTIPASMVETEIDRIEEEEKRNLVYRSQTWQEHLDQEGLTAEAHREKNREGAELRVKAGLVLTEVSEREKITVSPEELELRIQLLRGQYTDAAMQAELDKPENRRDIQSRLLTEKTLDKLKGYSTSP